VTWLIRMCDLTHSYVWQDSFVSVTWLIRMCDMTYVCMHMCDVIGLYVWHDSVTCVLCDAFICGTWLIHVCVFDFKPKPKTKPQPRIWHSASGGMTFSLIALHFHMYDMAHSYGWHEPFVCVTCLVDAQRWRWKQSRCNFRMLWRKMCTSDMTHSYVWHDSSIYVT